MSEVLRNKILKRSRGDERQTPSYRKTTITNSFVQGIIPFSPATEKGIDDYFKHFSTGGNFKCIYCNQSNASTIDHLHPIVVDKKASGYYDQLDNMVPCCEKCNSSKSGTDYIVWLDRQKAKAPKKRKVRDPDSAKLRVADFLKKYNPKPLDLATEVANAGIAKEYQDYRDLQQLIHDLLDEADKKAKVILAKLNAQINR